MTKYEQETIINFNEDEAVASIYTYNKSLIRKLDEMCLVDPNITHVKEGEGWKEYSLPKKWIKVHRPKHYSEEMREKMRIRALKNLHGEK